MIHELNSNQHRNYKTIPVETLNDTRLSSGARSLLFYMLGKDESYKVTYDDLCAAMNLHYRAVLRIMNELIEYEYVERECHSDPYEGGQFFWTFQVYAMPKRKYLHEIKTHLDRMHYERLKKNEAKATDIGTVRQELWGS